MSRNPVAALIRRDAIRQNVQTLRAQLPDGLPLCAAIKAEAYGHGFAQVLPILTETGVEQLAVAHLDEALHLRSLGWARPILCFPPALPYADEHQRFQAALEAIQADITCTIDTLDEAKIFARAAQKLQRRAQIEIQVDTGMGRTGLFINEADILLNEIARIPELTLDGVYTHFSSADELDLTFARQQLTLFTDWVQLLKKRQLPIRRFHAANSAAIFRLPTAHFDLVRPGLALYGYWAGPDEERPAGLAPIMRVTSCIAAIREIPADCPVGYGRTYITTRPTRLGIIPIGYADGYRRLLSSDAVITLTQNLTQNHTPNHCAIPVIGRISMDLITVDLTETPEVRVGDSVTLIDNQPDAPNSVEQLAKKLNTIPYEISCLIGPRVRRELV